MVQGRITGDPHVHQWLTEQRRIACQLQSHRIATVAQAAENINTGYNRNVSYHTMHFSLFMGKRTCRQVRMPMLNTVHHQRCPFWTHEHQNRTYQNKAIRIEQWKYVVWFDESCFGIHYMNIFHVTVWQLKILNTTR